VSGLANFNYQFTINQLAHGFFLKG
jgi:hypothetical protein